MSRYVGVDFDQQAIKWNMESLPHEFEFICSNFFNCSELKNNEFDAVISLDVIEHIAPTMEDKFCELISSSLRTDGIAAIGTPSIMMSPYTREENKIAHINLYDQRRLYELMSKYFRNIFIFNMNDEIVNVSFAPWHAISLQFVVIR